MIDEPARTRTLRRRRRRRAGRPVSRPRSTPPPKACPSSVLDCARLRRPGRRQRAHRELSGLSDRHLRAGARRPRLHAGAEIRRRDADSGRRSQSLDARRERDGALAPGSPNAGSVCARESVVVASGARYRRPEMPNLLELRGPRRLVLGLADRGALCAEPGGRARRRRQFGRAGRGVPVAATPRKVYMIVRGAGLARQHVALPDRPHRGHAQYRTASPRPR